MDALLHDAPFVQHQNPIGAHDGLDAVRNNQAGAILHHLVQRRLDFHLRLGIDRGRGSVQDQDARVLEQRPRQGDPLSLPAGERHAFLTDQSVVAFREGQDDVVDGGSLGRTLNLLVTDPPPDAIGDVVANRP